MIVIHLFYFASRVALIGTPDSHVTATPFSGDAGINNCAIRISVSMQSFLCVVMIVCAFDKNIP